MFRPVAFTGRAVEALIGTFVNVALLVNAAENFLHYFFMTFFRGADKIIIADIEFLPEILETGYDFVRVFDRLNASLFGFLLNLLAVLIRTGQKEYFLTGQTMETGNSVSNGRAVSMADMQFGTGIVNRGCDIKGFLGCHL
jgi:hypothetical protein